MNKAIIPTVIVALIVFAAIGFYLAQSNNPSTLQVENQTVTTQPSVTPVASVITESSYKDGTYSVTGNYVSPGGPRELNVTLTLADGVITNAETVGTATDATSKRFQGEFVNNFKPLVVGKNIDEVLLEKVAGSSLSPKGFNDAVEKIKTEAQS